MAMILGWHDLPIKMTSRAAYDSRRSSSRRPVDYGYLADIRTSATRRMAARVARVIRMDEVWLAVAPLDIRDGFDTALARVITVFGAVHAHHA
jgi:hypothetical protein